MTSPTPPRDPVERVARAIYEARNGRGCVPWSRRPREHQGPYRSDARAAISAVLELFSPPSLPAISAAVHAREDTGLTSAAITAAAKVLLGGTDGE